MSSVLAALSNELADSVEKAGRSVVAVHARPRIPSSGVVWRPGVVVTTDHTTERDEDITVTFSDGRNAAATVAGRDPSTDLAVLKFTAENIAAAETGDASTLRLGHALVTIGRGPIASLGTVSSIGPAWRTRRGGMIDRFIRLDLSIYYGFSGGALADAEGRILGINTSAISHGQPMSIPASTVDRVTTALLARGHIARGYLGVGMHPVRLPSGQGGVIVLSVEPDSPAASSGVLMGDVIVSIDGRPIGDTDDVQAALDPSSVGKRVALRLVRAGAVQELSLVIGERPRAT